MRVQESIEIQRPRDEVWTFVADRLNDTHWCRKVKSVAPVGEHQWRVIHKPVPLRPPMELDVRHIEQEPPSRLRMREEDEASIFDVEYRLEESGGGTRFTQISDVQWKKLPRLLHGTFRRGVRRDLQGQLRDLKRCLEQP